MVSGKKSSCLIAVISSNYGAAASLLESLPWLRRLWLRLFSLGRCGCVHLDKNFQKTDGPAMHDLGWEEGVAAVMNVHSGAPRPEAEVCM